MTKRVLFVNDLAKLMNTSPAAIRSHLQRRNFHAIPRPIILGYRVAWTIKQIEDFLRAKEEESIKGSMDKIWRRGRFRRRQGTEED